MTISGRFGGIERTMSGFQYLTVPERGRYTGVMTSPVVGSMAFETLNTARDMAQPMYTAASAKYIPGQLLLHLLKDQFWSRHSILTSQYLPNPKAKSIGLGSGWDPRNLSGLNVIGSVYAFSSSDIFLHGDWASRLKPGSQCNVSIPNVGENNRSLGYEISHVYIIFRRAMGAACVAGSHQSLRREGKFEVT